ncbi:DUF3221 domain-containing protein [Paenisporosarcina indica]|uniref:DUF3221 domain-containing protein n=1 Tax=Paenisporosarcina indica TaxID=650093 RepID=UPI00094F5C97|nr:DUF3221 domain-containing protein [Paenisporosarcina indica]
MKNRKFYTSLLAISLLLTGCGTGDATVSTDQKLTGDTAVKSEDPNWPTIKVVSGRDIIAELKQTTTNPKIRNDAFTKVKESEELTQGLFGKVTPELEEDMGVQGIEAQAAFQAIDEVYGGHEGLLAEGVVFFENQADGAQQSGFWIGLKEPDDRLIQYVDTLQKKVDAGEILAKHIYIYKSAFTEKENYDLTDNVFAAVNAIAKSHPNPDRLSSGISVDTITGTIEITHDFLTEAQQESLQKQFTDRKIEFTQDGRMVAGPSESDITYPTEPTTTNPSKDGAYVINVSENGMLIVNAMPTDYSSTGGESDFYSAVNYTYPNADEKLEVGQRVIVESSGPMALSYPGQGRVKYVEVLPTYKPETADFTEAEIVRVALSQSSTDSGWSVPISNISYDEKTDRWSVEFAPEREDKFTVEIKDSKS